MKKALATMKKIGLILLGNMISAAGIVFFLVPTGFITGGVTGFALALEQFFGLPIHYGILMLSIFLLLLGLLLLGKEFAVSSALSAVSYPLFVWGFEILSEYIQFTVDNIFLNLAACAILLGYGIATIMRQGASSGGIDVIAVILNKKTGLSLSFAVALLEILAMLTQVVYSSPEQILGGVLVTISFTALLNHFVSKEVARVQVMVYSEQYEKIYEYVETKLDRGCTLFRVQGGYKREDTFALQIIISNRELFKLKEQIRKIDPVAFVTVSKVSEVGGRGFSLAKDAPSNR